MYNPQLLVEWRLSTLVFYLSIIIGGSLMSSLGSRKALTFGKHNAKVSIGAIAFFLIAVFIKGFGNVGVDLRTGYYLDYISATSINGIRDTSLEIGYKLLNVLLHNLGLSYEVYIFVVSLITLFPIVFFLNKYRTDLWIWQSVLVYLSIFFYPGFSLIRISIAGSIALFAFDAMIEKKTYKAFIYILIASSFHYSATILLGVLFIVNMKKINKKNIVFLALAIVVCVYIGQNYILMYMKNSSRYYNYGINETISIGLEQLVYHLPIIMLLWVCDKYESNREYFKVSICYTLISFSVGIISYIFPIFGRMYHLFLPLVFIIPHYIKMFCDINQRWKWFMYFLLGLYCIARFIIYIYQYYRLDGIMPYMNVFGFII